MTNHRIVFNYCHSTVIGAVLLHLLLHAWLCKHGSLELTSFLHKSLRQLIGHVLIMSWVGSCSNLATSIPCVAMFLHSEIFLTYPSQLLIMRFSCSVCKLLFLMYYYHWWKMIESYSFVTVCLASIVSNSTKAYSLFLSLSLVHVLFCFSSPMEVQL